MFEKAKVGDKVWTLYHGWGIITGVYPKNTKPVKVDFGDYKRDYTLQGYANEGHIHQSLFWDEIKFEIPTRPLPKLEVDTKVLVWNNDRKEKCCRYFSHFDENKKACTFHLGTTSWSNERNFTSPWDNWKLAKEE